MDAGNIIKRSMLVVTMLLTATATLLPVANARDQFGIVDYQPSVFAERSTTAFFFSISDKLRFGTAIDETSEVLFSGKLTAVFPSPDEKKATIISGDKLYLVEPGRPQKLLLTAVDNYAAFSRSLGEIFYEYPSLQWDASSHNIYIIRATKDNGPTQMFPRGSTLVRIDAAESGHIIDVVPDFRSLHYFLVGDNAVCFDYAPGNGDVIWKCVRNGVETAAPKTIKDDRILLEDGTSVEGRPFLSYHPNIYESEIWLTLYGFSLRPTQDRKLGLFSKDRPDAPILLVKTGYNIKGMFGDVVMQYGCAVLPGGRYALLNIADGGSTVQMLVDGLTGQYRRLPGDTHVYRNLNTFDYENVRIGFQGTDSNEFIPSGRLRPATPGTSR